MDLKKEYEFFVREALGLPPASGLQLTLVYKGGSDRVFYRVGSKNGTTAVLMHYSPERRENNLYADIAEFLGKIGVTVPAVIRHDPSRHLILMEDLGEEDLMSFRNAPWKDRQTLYRDTLELADRLHTFPPENFPSRRIRLMEAFGPALYRWERDYFREHFVEGICRVKLDPEESGRMERELSALAGHVQNTAPALIHRDLQSRNVMIRGGVPVLIDFQGMRPGSPFYDLGSLLYDPYVSFSDEERMELLSYYYVLSKRTLNWKDFCTAFYEASVQRLMQALGAYGYLGVKHGIKEFLEHIPRGLENLIDAAGRVKKLRRLRNLLMMCRKKIEDAKMLS